MWVSKFGNTKFANISRDSREKWFFIVEWLFEKFIQKYVGFGKVSRFYTLLYILFSINERFPFITGFSRF